jgi:hypothetical protein
MFALGASGTGKTSRYFGVNSTDPGDQVGIVSSIIESSKAGGSIVSLAYFICYGRKTNSGNDFTEQIIFLDEDNNTSSWVEANPNPVNNISTYTDFYSALVNKKLKKINFDSNYVTNGAVNLDQLSQPSEPSELKTFRQILESEKIWEKLDGNKDLKDLTVLFNSKLAKQKELKTVLPTKNNVESSRGHTCVLIRITTNSSSKYFPLFDMAGTENPEQMKTFLMEDNNPVKMYNLIQLISEESKAKTIKDGELKVSSLAVIVEFNTFKLPYKFVSFCTARLCRVPTVVKLLLIMLRPKLTELITEMPSM